jgi:hypothetical protein
MELKRAYQRLRNEYTHAQILDIVQQANVLWGLYSAPRLDGEASESYETWLDNLTEFAPF